MGQLQQRPLPVGAESESRERVQDRGAGERGGAQFLGVALSLQQPVGLDTYRPVSGTAVEPVVASHQGVRMPSAMPLLVVGQGAADDHGSSGVHRRQGLRRVVP